MRLVVIDKYSKPVESGTGYFVKVESNDGIRVVNVAKKRYFRAEIGNKIEITVRELKEAEKAE